MKYKPVVVLTKQYSYPGEGDEFPEIRVIPLLRSVYLNNFLREGL